ncbi:hypothetical protein E8F20_21845 [Pseudomonas sp. BN415]|nr:hypothetical protein [Pseudomonas sp. BN415]
MGVSRLDHPAKLRSHPANGRRLFEVRPVDGALACAREWAWDSGLSETFQLESQGRNPSSGAGQRTQHLWLHKFGNAFKERYDGYGGEGCGRCKRAGMRALQVLRGVNVS